MGNITVTGLGPGNFGLITMESWELIQGAEHLYLRTEIHPTVAEIKKRGIKYSSYDGFYEEAESFETLYTAIAEDLVKKAESGENLVYVVPGSPLVAERTVVLLRDLAQQHNVPITILPGMSFVEIMYTRLGIDPIDGLTIIDAEDFDRLPVDLPTGIVVTQVYNQQIASDTKLSLMDVYGDDFEVVYVHNLGMKDESIRKIPLFELDRQDDIDHLTSLYVPAKQAAPAFDMQPLVDIQEAPVLDMQPLVDVIRRLREPGGCPWDIAQDHKSIRQNLIEETYEVLEAIDLEDSDLLCEELGDLLLQVVFHARMSEESGDFSMQDVVDGVTEKLVRRHPHVFTHATANDAVEALRSWEEAKAKEKKDRISVLDGIPKGLPALMTSQKIVKKARKVGFYWDDVQGIWDKIQEEVNELKEAMAEGDKEHIQEEFGDVLFSLVCLAVYLNVDSEVSLMQTNCKFMQRFRYVENEVMHRGGDWMAFSPEELDDFWRAAKQEFSKKN